jgi:hypothetical protein
MSKLILLLLFAIPLEAQTWKKAEVRNTICPPHYILVPHKLPYTTRDFCVGKYETKELSESMNFAPSPSRAPVVSIRRDYVNAPFNVGMRVNCQGQGPGFDLISNDQWQTIARDIAGVDSNWSGGVAYSGELNRGHSDGAPANSLAASTDDDPCFGTGETCSASVWNSQRRTHTLSNGNVIWDFAGNVHEYVSNVSTISPGASDYAANFNSGDYRQTSYGHDSFCALPSVSPYCGYGYGIVATASGAVARGGDYDDGVDAGVFAAKLDINGTSNYSTVGSRCVFQP